MKLAHAIALVLVLCALPVAARADGVMTVPQVEHDPWGPTSTGSFIVTVDVTAALMLDSYTVALDVVSRSGVDPCGLWLTDYAEAPLDYLIDDNMGFGVGAKLLPDRVFVDDAVAGAAEEKTPGAYGTVEVFYEIDPDRVQVCNYYDLVLDDEWCTLLDENLDDVPLQLVNGYTHIAVPEPATLSLLALAGLAGLKRRP